MVRTDFYDAVVERVREVEWDVEGRFLICETRAFGSFPKLAIVNVYAVNGTDAAYKDPETGKIAGTRHDRKLQVHASLQAGCRQLELQGIQVILAGNLNITRSRLDAHPRLREFPERHCTNRADFESRFFESGSQKPTTANALETVTSTGLGMIDTWRHLHPHQTGYTYYPWGKDFGTSCDRVDMILVSKSLEPMIQEAEIQATQADRGPSDHVPLYVVFG